MKSDVIQVREDLSFEVKNLYKLIFYPTNKAISMYEIQV